jgi:hypothetical protein
MIYVIASPLKLQELKDYVTLIADIWRPIIKKMI